MLRDVSAVQPIRIGNQQKIARTFYNVIIRQKQREVSGRLRDHMPHLDASNYNCFSGLN